MKTITLNIIKKNRKYFKAEFESGCPCKLRITPESDHLEPGKHELLVHDVSVRSKYGTDLIYEMIGEQKQEDGVVTLQHPKYNDIVHDECKKLGGRWDSENKAWVFPKMVEDEVEQLDEIFNSEWVTVEIVAGEKCCAHTGPLTFCGYTVAKAWGRDSGAKLADEVALIEGKIYSGGSMKNWYTEASESSVFRLEVPKLVLEEYQKYEMGEWETIEVKS